MYWSLRELWKPKSKNWFLYDNSAQNVSAVVFGNHRTSSWPVKSSFKKLFNLIHFHGSWLIVQQFFGWRFHRSSWGPMTLKKLQHEHFGLNYHSRRTFFYLGYHSSRSDQYNPPYFWIFKLKYYRTAKPKSNKNTCSVTIRVRWKRWGHPFFDMLRCMTIPDKIFQLPL